MAAAGGRAGAVTVHSLAAAHRAADAARLAPQPRRLVPPPGRLLRLSDIRGPWWPGIDVGAIFAVRWETPAGLRRWAALCDFEPAALQRLLDECRRADCIAGRSG